MVSIFATSSGSTLIRRRVSGFMVVSHIMSGSFSPRPFERLMEHFWSPISFKMSFFSEFGVGKVGLFLAVDLIQRRLGDIDIALVDERGYQAVEHR